MSRLLDRKISFLSLLAVCVLVAGALGVSACDDGEEPGDTTDTVADTTTGDTTQTDTTGPTELTGEDRTYRLTDLSLRDPDIVLKDILNSVINTSIDLDPGEPEAVHVLLRFSSWDTSVTPPSLTLEGGAGTPDLAADPLVFSFRPDAEVVAVPSTYAMVDGFDQIANSEPTNLVFPLNVGMSTTLLPLRDILIQACYGNNRNCENAEGERILYGSLTGGIVAAEAEAIQVELSEGEPPTPLGEILRDPTTDCTANTDCSEGRECAAASGKCERLPDITIEGEPAFSLAGVFKAEEVEFSAE